MIESLEPVAELTALGRNQKGLRVRFLRAGDRYRHVIENVAHGHASSLLESLEGGTEPDWPASPPFQHLQISQADGGQIVLMTGAAGNSHWSISVSVAQFTFVEDDSDEFHQSAESTMECLLFDVACRLKSSPEWLGSTYRTIDGVPRDALGSFAFADGCFVVPPSKLFLSLRPDNLCDGNVATWQSEVGVQCVRIMPTVENIAKLPATVRWSYAMVWGLN